MSDLDKELNFDDIAGQKKKSVKKAEKKQVVAGKTAKSTGIVLAVPTNNPSVFAHLDLAKCTGHDFVQWAKGVYPVDLSEHTEQLNDVSKRIQAFKQILYYHTHSPL